MRDFDYKLISKNDVTIISFSGHINKDCKDLLETCRQEIISDSAKMIVLYFEDVTSVEPCVFREFTIIQHEIRLKKIELFITGLNSPTRKFLIDHAVIRLNEIRKNLSDVFEDKIKAA